MVHNGIEYADMQLIAEAYDLMSTVLGMKAAEIAEVFKKWNEGDLDSFLIQITAEVLAKIDDQGTGKPLVDMILDEAAQKGTGKWTSQSALDMGIPIMAITDAVNARFISALKDERVAASKVLKGPAAQATSTATKSSSSATSATLSTPPKSAPTLRAFSCSTPPRKKTTGTWTTA